MLQIKKRKKTKKKNCHIALNKIGNNKKNKKCYKKY